MSKELVKILYNPSSLTSTMSEDEPGLSETTFDHNGQNFDRIQRLKESSAGEKTTLSGLIALKRQFTLPLALHSRLSLLQEFNDLLKTLAMRHTNAIDIFQCCVQMISLLKEQIENRPNVESANPRGEWVELEKSIYHLSSWESQLDYFWSALH